MSDKPRNFNLSAQKPLFQMFIALMIIVGVGLILLFILIGAGMLVFGGDISVLSKSTETLSQNDVLFMRYLLIVQDVSLLLVPAMLILILLKPASEQGFTELKIPQFNEIFLVVLLTFCLFPVTSFTGEINSRLHLPQWLSGVEEWMKQKEDSADNLIESLADSHTTGLMLINLITIALVPAISEEFIFRGVFQKIFERMFRSGHMAIWVTSIVFSAIHFQFFGFIPRLILGLTFGYLYWWSGTLWLPVTAHFVNNAFPVVMAYLHGVENLTSQPAIPLWKQAISVPVPMFVILMIMLWFRNKKAQSENIT